MTRQGAADLFTRHSGEEPTCGAPIFRANISTGSDVSCTKFAETAAWTADRNWKIGLIGKMGNWHFCVCILRVYNYTLVFETVVHKNEIKSFKVEGVECAKLLTWSGENLESTLVRFRLIVNVGRIMGFALRRNRYRPSMLSKSNTYKRDRISK